MSKNVTQAESHVSPLKNEAARKRWEVFHLAIAHAKKSNLMAMQEADLASAESKRTSPLFLVAR